MHADPSPFPYQGPLPPELVTGRMDLLQDLCERIAERRVTALIGPRRFGKTSLLKKAAADLEQVGMQSVWIDLYEIQSMADLAVALDRGLDNVRGRLRRVLDDMSATLSINLGVATAELNKGKRERPDASLLARSRLELLVKAAQREPTMVVFDEFSGIDGVDGAAGLLRTELQHHYRDLGIVFAGSEPSTMRMLFSEQAQPFFAQADLITVGPLERGAVIAIVDDGFAATDRDPARAGRFVADFAQGHPQRSMQIADAIWRHTTEGAAVDDETIAAALSEVRANADMSSDRYYAVMAKGQQKVLRVLAAGGSIYGAAAERVNLAPGTAQSALDALRGNGQIIDVDARPVITDPLLADWLRRRFP